MALLPIPALAAGEEAGEGDFWVNGRYYVYGEYPEDTTISDIDWSESIDSMETPLSTVPGNNHANVYILNSWTYEEEEEYGTYIGQLDLGGGSVICLDETNKLIWLTGSDEDSFLKAESIIYDYESSEGDNGGEIYFENLDVHADSIHAKQYLSIFESDVTAGTLTGAYIIMSDAVLTVDSDVTLEGETVGMELSGDSAAMFHGSVTAEGMNSQIIMGGDAALTVDGDVTIKGMMSWIDLEGNATLAVGGNVTVEGEISGITMNENNAATVHGNVTVMNTGYDDETPFSPGIDLKGNAALSVGGDVTEKEF